jgi:riboflavin synthase
MFTGLIEDVGTIKSVHHKHGAAVVSIQTRLPMRDMELGASIAVNGACLTVVRKARGVFTVDVSPETLKRTRLGALQAGSAVNLERPMRLADRLGGHIVTGHIDGVAAARSIEKRGEFTFMLFRVSAGLGSLLVSKGSVAVDGISLTVNDCGLRYFSVAIIPFTLEHTNLRHLEVGDKVNVETDLIGKYVHSFLDRTAAHRRTA